MKKITVFILSLLLLFNLVGCGNRQKQEALLNYINVDLAELSEMETAFTESYGSVTGDNYTNDYVLYEELTNITSTLARKLNDKAVELVETIEDEEILEVHKKYMKFASNNLNAINLILSAVENQDYSQVSLANEKLNEATTIGIDFRKELNSLAEKYNVVIEK